MFLNFLAPLAGGLSQLAAASEEAELLVRSQKDCLQHLAQLRSGPHGPAYGR